RVPQQLSRDTSDVRSAFDRSGFAPEGVSCVAQRADSFLALSRGSTGLPRNQGFRGSAEESLQQPGRSPTVRARRTLEQISKDCYTETLFPIPRSTLQHQMQRTCRKLKLEGLSLHSFRHTFGTRLG